MHSKYGTIFKLNNRLVCSFNTHCQVSNLPDTVLGCRNSHMDIVSVPMKLIDAVGRQ